MKYTLIISFLFFFISIGHGQEIENGKYNFKSLNLRQIVEIKDSEILTYSERIQMKKYVITERRKIEDVSQIICDLGNGYELVVSQTMNGKNLFMYKRGPNDKPSSNLKYWHVKRRQSNKLRKLRFKQTKTNW